MNQQMLTELEQTLRREMPICDAMGIEAVDWGGGVLTMAMPLAPNRNHQYSAFAGSLNALCTVVGWGSVFLLLREQGLLGNIVIRRGAVRYLRPVRDERIVARGKPIAAESVDFFFELLESKGKSKIDVSAEVSDSGGGQVRFTGSYVVQDLLA